MTGIIQLFYFILSLASGFILLGLAYRSWQRRHVVSAYAFIAMMLSVSVWAMFYAAEVASNSLEGMVLAQRFKYLGVTTVPVAWFVFSARYSGRIPRMRPLHLGWLLIIPALTLILIWTSDYHSLMFISLNVETTAGFPTLVPTYGIGWGINLIYSYGLILVGSYWLMQTAVQSLALFRHHVRLILIGVAIPVLGSIITIAKIGPFQGVDLTPMLFTITAVLFDRLLTHPTSPGAAPVSYQAIIDNLPEAVMMVDSQYTILSVNPPMMRLLRQEEASILGTSIRNLIPGVVNYLTQQPGWISTSQEIVMAGRYIELNISALHDPTSHQEGYVLVFRDNTIRKQTEAALYANERRYRTLFEKSNDAILIIDLDTNVIIANDEAASLLDTDLAKLLQQGLIHYLPPPDYERFRKYVTQLVAGETIPIYETTFVRFNGVKVPAEVSLTLVRTTDGEPLQAQMIVRDITERKQAEQIRETQLRQLRVMREVDEQVNSSLDIHNVIQVSLHKAVEISKADAGFIALTEGDAVTIKQVAGLFAPRFIEQKLQYDVGITGHVLESHEPEMVLDVVADSRYVPDIPETKAVMTLPLISQERLVGVIHLETVTPNNFTQEIFNFIQLLANRISVAVDNARLYEYVHKQLEETELLNEDLRRAEALKTDMIRIANHDIKNPLSIAQGYVSLLQADQSNFAPEYADFFQEMAKALERMSKILDDFLSVEAANQRAAGATMKPLDMQGLAVRAIGEYQQQATVKFQSLNSNIVQPGIANVIGDEAQLYEAMTNLISNAIKYTPGEGTITVELSITPENEVCYQVHDTGYGIPEDRQGRLFEPFYRSKTAETATIEGTGLGLHLVKNIIDRHKGKMVFKSVYHEGSSFGFTLPLNRKGINR